MNIRGLLHHCMHVSLLTSLTFFHTTQLQAQFVQLGMDIDGEAAFDNSGQGVSLSADGTRVAIGAPNNDGNGIDAGHVRVFDFDGTDWIQVGMNIDGEAAGDASGISVSLSSDGTRVAIGAPNNDGRGSGAGHVRVYAYDGSAWVQEGMDIDGEAEFDEFGRSISLSTDGMRLAIGASRNGANAGHVRVYDFDGTNWVQVGMDIDGEAAGDASGISVSLSSDGTRVAIGAPNNDGRGSGAGHVRVYAYDGSAWVQVGMDIDGEAAEDFAGFSVSLSADGMRLAIGALGNDANGDRAGHVRVFEYDGTNWVQVGINIDGEAEFNDSGASVSLSADGRRVVIGAAFNDGNGDNAGHVRVFDFDGTDWVQVGMDIDGEALSDLSGTTVLFSSDGTRVAIGAIRNDGSGIDAGHVRVFDLDIVNGVSSFLSETPSGQLLIYPNPHTGDQLSWSIPDLPTAFQSATILIHDAYGKLVISKNINTQNILPLNEPLASGIYFVTLNTRERSYLEKLIVQNE